MLLALVLLVLALFLLLGIYVRWWTRKFTRLAEATGVMNESNTFALHLVHHFMPTFKVAKYQFRGMQPARSAELNIAFVDLAFELKNGKKVLQRVTGEFRSGRMVAIMGPSGCGKTTMLNVLCGKATYGKASGAISINGLPTQVSNIKSMVGFVPQDDVVYQNLTVREQIYFSARLRNEVGLSKKRLRNITDDVLSVMQIDHIQNSITGGVECRGISGGQRKRVNIGLELAAQPSLLFLDEPTSGLDATSSLAVCFSLKKMCQLGMTSIMVIHQPRYSLFTLFDDVLLLGKGGRVCYLGNSFGAKPYFESVGFRMPANENPADWFMDIISGEAEHSTDSTFKPELLFDLWQENVSTRPQQIGADDIVPGRSMTDTDCVKILSQRLEEEWDMIDTNKDGVMQQDELKELLAECAGCVPDDKVVHELFVRMATHEADVVTREECVEYLTNLRDDVVGQHEHMATTSATRALDSLHEDEELHGADGISDAEAGDPERGLTPKSWLRYRRKAPGFCLQWRVLLRRVIVQWWRNNGQRAIFYSILAIGVAALGVLDKYVLEMPYWSAAAFLNSQTALALLIAIFCLNVFSVDIPVFWRERSSGLNVLAFFHTKILMNLIDLIMMTVIYSAIYYLIRYPPVAFEMFLIPYLLVSYAASGWGYLVSTIAPPRHGPFIVSLVIFIICGLLATSQTLERTLDGKAMEAISGILSITRWSIMMSFNYAVHVEPPEPEGTIQQFTYKLEKDVYTRGVWDIGAWWTAFVCLAIMGTVLRLAALAGLLVMHRDKSA
eukprot:TRINITY_DN10682_c0_g3_i2.p1 TRINITY_DN10682_c0_g3~~TRINITY_DN10682_c0_g3_i2.p1  ORF type:complete len:783 (+),score=145.19 TRINITY_DN10682_c0_g3_i2:66-2414(+)